MLGVPARRRRRARLDHDHRVGHRHPAGQHADRRARRPLRPRPALPDPRARRPLARARLRLPAVSAARRALTPEAAERLSALSRLHRARRRLQDRDARPRAARRRQPARRRAVRPRRGARLRALHADARRGGARDGRTRTARRSPSRCASTSTSTPTCPADYIPYEQAKVDVHRRIAGAREVAELVELRDELEDRFGALAGAAREPDHAPAGADQARPGRARARSSFRGGRLAVTPIELDSATARSVCAEICRARSTSPGARSSRCGSPTTRAQRFPAVVARGGRAAGRPGRCLKVESRDAAAETPLPCAAGRRSLRLPGHQPGPVRPRPLLGTE